MIRVLVVDDSALVRSLLKEIIGRQPDMEMVGAAPNPLVAREMIKRLDPHVLTLDIEMPQMDGLEFLSRLMRLRPMPVVMFSTLTERGSRMALRALELGAVDFIAKPKLGLSEHIDDYADEIADKIRAAARARLRRRTLADLAVERYDADVILPPKPLAHPSSLGGRVIAIGASTGGTEALREVLTRLPVESPPIVIAQHMPEGFTRAFAERLDRLCRIRVAEAEAGARLQSGQAFIAPGNRHLLLVRRGGQYYLELNDGPPVNRHRPSVDVLFESVAAANVPAVGVILTGMGRDGASGLKKMRERGALTIGQDSPSSTIYGMPRVAMEEGAVERQLALSAIGPHVLRLCAADADR